MPICPKLPHRRTAAIGGFTLTETVVVLAASAVAVLASVPCLKGWHDKLALDEAVSLIRQSFEDARALAMRQGVPVELGLPLAVRGDAVQHIQIVQRDGSQPPHPVTRSALPSRVWVKAHAGTLPQFSPLDGQPQFSPFSVHIGLRGDAWDRRILKVSSNGAMREERVQSEPRHEHHASLFE